MYTDAYHAVTEANKWEFLKTYNLNDTSQGSWSLNPEILEILKCMKYIGHSGGSMYQVMSIMTFIAVNGWDKFVEANAV